MGTSTFVNQTHTRAASHSGGMRGSSSTISRRGMDWILFGVVIGMTLFGLLMVYSAGTKFANEIGLPPEYFLIRQAIWAGAGLVTIFVFSRLDYHIFQRLTVLLMGGTLLMLLAVIIMGNTTLGANRSLVSGSIRPSELAKLVTIIYVSVWLNSKSAVLNDITLGLVPLMLILGFAGGLILIQPDLSAAITVVMLGGILFFLAGGEWRQIALTMVVAGLVGWVIVNVYPTGIARIRDYVDGLRNLLNASYHVQRSLEAVIHGGLFGVGIGHGSAKFTGLPVAPTDSIFAVIAEETGLLGTGGIIVAYLVFMWRGLQIARRAPDKLGALLASGITIWIVIEAMLNMSVMVNLLPQVGNALPLVSYGGSSLTITLASIGVLMNISRSSARNPGFSSSVTGNSTGTNGSKGIFNSFRAKSSSSSTGGSSFGAVVDLRWRDRRRSVSRSGRLPGSGR
jgi:cell division protein FtsW